MRKRFNLEIMSDKLAEEMWGNMQEKFIIVTGVILYECEDYKGIVVNNKEFNIDKNLEKKINPMIVIETYSYRGKKFVIERTNRKEKIPENLQSKFENKKYDERISIFALTEESIKLIKYYHKNVLKNIYEKKIGEKARKYKSLNGFINSEMRESIKYLSLKSPEFIKSKDKKKAMDFLEKELNKTIKNLEITDKKDSFRKELIKDKYIQRRELIR